MASSFAKCHLIFRISLNSRGQNGAALLSTSLKTHQNRKPDWNRAVSDAEKIVGYPTSYLTLRSLFSDEMSNIADHLRKLIGSSHPLLKTAKRLVYNGRNNMQTRGLIVLLISKAAGHVNTDLTEHSLPAGVSHNQRSLAEITEIIHTAHLIHKGVVNLSPCSFSDSTTLSDMEFGNKISILLGDYLLANACTGLASLKNAQVVELISTAISDFIEAEFVGLRDKQDNPLPSSFTIRDWEDKNFLAAGSLMAKSCKGTTILAGHNEEIQDKAFQFGRHLALAWQVYNDLQPFLDPQRHPPGSPFDLSSAPVVLHLQQEGEALRIPFLQAAEKAKDSDVPFNFEKLNGIICAGSAVAEAQTLCRQYAGSALSILQGFKPSDAKTALENIVHALREM